MLKLRALRVATMLWLACLWPQMAAAQTLTTFNSEAGYTAALPAPGVTTTVESFSTVTSDRLVSTGTPDVWTGFRLVTSGTSPWGPSAYCASLSACMSYTPSPPALPGIYGAFAQSAEGNGRLTFTPDAGTIGFGLNYWDWNDSGQRSQIVVTLSNGAVFNVTGPTTAPGDPGGFIGFRIDQASVNAGIAISSVVWLSQTDSEIVGMRNVRTSRVNPLVVTNTNDSGPGSLRNAVLAANANSGPDTISFAIPGTGPHTITLSTPLPPFLGAGDTIDGTTQPGASCGDLWAGTPPNLRVHLTAGAIGTGLHLEAADLTVRGLAITGFTNKVYIHPFASNVTIRCNYIGLLPDGTRGVGTTNGVLIDGAGTVVGGLDAGEGNVISGNSVGVQTAIGSTNTAVRGNFIGTDPTGMSAIANGRGVTHLNGAGSWRDITRNLIAGNTQGEIRLDTGDTITPSNGQILIQRNVLGYNRTQSAKLQAASLPAIFANTGSISNVLVGGDAATQGNVIGGAAGGIHFLGASNITIQGNTIAGSTGLGLLLSNVNGAAIGGSAAGLGNIIGANTVEGILARSGTTNLSILGNTIGFATIAGTTAGNGDAGIVLSNVSNVTIGDGTADGRNVIGGNGSRAIGVNGTNSGITINGNYIGTDASGNVAVANGWNLGSTVRDAIAFDNNGNFSNLAIRNNVIGGYSAALVEFWTGTGTGITIQGNNIGVGADGVSQIVTGNTEALIFTGGGGSFSSLLIGGSAPGQGNLVANSSVDGVTLNTTGTNIQVIGNTIRNNAAQGIRVLSPTIASVLGNSIFANGGLGIDLNNDGVTLNDPGDGDSGPNDLLNYPTFTGLNVAAGGQLSYALTLDVPAESNGYRIDFYRNSSADPSGFGEGEEWLGFIETPAHGGGAIAYNGTFAPLAPVDAGNLVSATATRKTGAATYGATSEFNQNATIVAPLVVTNTNDAGAGSLRNAITFANTQTSPPTVSFAIPGAGPHTITLSSVLPNVAANGLTIDGSTQPGSQCRDLWAGNGHDLRINVRGNSAFNGFRLAGANQTIRGLSITGFNDGVELLASSNMATLHCNYIGLLANGTSSANTGRGVHVFGASARIGGVDAGQGNVISSNSAYGVQTRGGSSDTAIRGNFIGTDAAGMAARGNGRSINNQDGSATWRDITRNLVSGNGWPGGITLEPDDRITASDGQIRIQGNIIGFNRNLSAALRNGGDGMFLDAGSIAGVLIGGNTTAEANFITGDEDGIDLRSASNVTIRGNTIAASGARGLHLNNVSTAEIGGSSAGQGNSIGGNGGGGIYLTNSSSNITILGNLVQPITIFGSTLANGGNGIWLDRASNVTIGNGTAAGRNIVAGNAHRAIQSTDTNSAITINGNYIGTDASGNVAVGNAQGMDMWTRDAVTFSSGSFTGITIANNVMGGHAGALIEFWDTAASNVVIQGNSFGVGTNGASIMPADGVEPIIFAGGPTRNYSDMLIGGTSSGQGNIIANSANSGIRLESTGSNIQIIGNTIRNNAAFGVTIFNNTRAAIVSNRIFANGLIGIDLNDDWVTQNDAGDGDSGSNDLLNFPAAIRAVVAGPSTLQGSFTLDAPAADYRIEFFASSTADPSGHGGGERYLGHVDIYHPGGVGTTTGTLTTVEPVSIGDVISATTTRRTAGGTWDITSEFSAVVTADGVAALTVAMASEVFDPAAGIAYAAPGSDILLTTTVSNNGNGSTDADSLFVAIAISPDMAFFNDVTPALGGVVGFATAAPALTFTPGTDLRFSNSAAAPSSLAQCTYTPVAGYDPAVRHVCVNPKGALPNGSPQGQFTLQMRARIN